MNQSMVEFRNFEHQVIVDSDMNQKMVELLKIFCIYRLSFGLDMTFTMLVLWTFCNIMCPYQKSFVFFVFCLRQKLSEKLNVEAGLSEKTNVDKLFFF